MNFQTSDVYTTSGSVKLFNKWTPNVTKFDTSSFYNWEQDNLPVYDLEERTYETWEQAGFPASSIPGLALVVSGGPGEPEYVPGVSLPTNAQREDNPNLFSDVSAAIDALPKVIRFPVIVEVASFGELGPLELHNLNIIKGGSLEIINRNFAKTFDVSAVATAVGTTADEANYGLITEFSS